MASRSLIYTSTPDVSYSSAGVIAVQLAVFYLTTVSAADAKVLTASQGPVSTFSPVQKAYTNGHYEPVQDEILFNLLVQQWHQERGISSSIADMVLCPSYQRIIAMGQDAMSLILRQLQREGDDPDHWFWALEMITGQDPVPAEAYGDNVAIAQAWLSWARGRYAW
jgi:hypothetical protein